MTTEDLANRISTTRERLRQIELERGRLAPHELGEKARLLDEAHTLQARLGELEEMAARRLLGSVRQQAAAQTDLTRTPRPQGS